MTMKSGWCLTREENEPHKRCMFQACSCECHGPREAPAPVVKDEEPAK